MRLLTLFLFLALHATNVMSITMFLPEGGENIKIQKLEIDKTRSPMNLKIVTTNEIKKTTENKPLLAENLMKEDGLYYVQIIYPETDRPVIKRLYFVSKLLPGRYLELEVQPLFDESSTDTNKYLMALKSFAPAGVKTAVNTSGFKAVSSKAQRDKTSQLTTLEVEGANVQLSLDSFQKGSSSTGSLLGSITIKLSDFFGPPGSIYTDLKGISGCSLTEKTAPSSKATKKEDAIKIDLKKAS